MDALCPSANCGKEETVMSQPITIFIADASEEYIGLLHSALEEDPDLRVVGTASSGTAAYQQMRELRPDLLITDLLLPGLDGISLLRQLQAEGLLSHVIVISGFFNDRIAKSVSQLADNYLPKPCRTGDLIAHIRECVLGREKEFVLDLKRTVGHALVQFGVPIHLDGFDYLQTAIVMALEDRGVLRGVTKSLYRDIARHYGTTAVCVERSVRSAIEHAWERRTSEERRRCFGYLFDSYQRPPSNVPFLTAMTEHVYELSLKAEHFG